MLDIPLASSDNVSDKISLRRRAEQFGIIGTHSIMQRVVDVCQILAPSPLPMLLLGETGTGKSGCCKPGKVELKRGALL